MKKLFFAVLILTFALASNVLADEEPARKIIIDTDTGADDASALIIAANSPELIEDSRLCHGSCVTAPGETCGQVIFYQKGFSYDLTSGDFDYNVTLVCKVRHTTRYILQLLFEGVSNGIR